MKACGRAKGGKKEKEKNEEAGGKLRGGRAREGAN